jgi:hypothetical protein
MWRPRDRAEFERRGSWVTFLACLQEGPLFGETSASSLGPFQLRV